MVKIEIIPDSLELLKMTDEEYFSSTYKDYLSNSKLSLLNPDEGGSMEKFNSGFKSDYSDSFELGSAVHCALLQPDFFHISDIRKPSGKLGLFAENFLKYRQQGLSINDSILKSSEESNYYSGKMTPARIKTAIKTSLPFYLKRNKVVDSIQDKKHLYLSEAIFNKTEACLSGALNNRKLMELLNPKGLLEDPEVFNEYAILCEANIYEDDVLIKTIKLKSKLDNFTIDHEEKVVTLNDLKTSGKPVNFFMGNNVKQLDELGNEVQVWIDGSFQKYRYYRQMGMYMWMLQSALHKKLSISSYTYKANMLVIETIPNFNSKVFRVSNKEINKGLVELKELLTLFAHESK